MFFLTGLRQVHNAFHGVLGLPRTATDWVMLILSVLMLGPMHAVQVCHLRHHRFCLSEQDVEGRVAKRGAWRALAIGPLYPAQLHYTGWRHAGARRRRWIGAELLPSVVVIFLALGVEVADWWTYHVLAMSCGQCLTGFCAVWTVHRGASSQPFHARTIRNRITAALTYDVFYHAEHHMYPTVPTRNLAVLARRLDVAQPGMQPKMVF